MDRVLIALSRETIALPWSSREAPLAELRRIERCAKGGWGAIASLTFSALFFVGVWLTVRRRTLGVALIGLMCVLEIAVFPGLKRATTADWVVQIAFLVVTSIGLVGAVSL